METIIMDMLDYTVKVLVEFDVMSASICFPQDNYYTIISSICVQCWVMLFIVVYDGGMFVRMTSTIS